MKKILLSLFSLALAGSLQAQVIWQDNFNGTTPPALPTGWTQYNGDALTVDPQLANYSFGTNAWVSRIPTGSTDGFMVSTSWYTPAGTSNDWLISPAVTPTAGAWLLFDAVTPDANYKDGYQVKISNSPSPSSFTAAPVLTVAAEGQSWATRAIDLSPYVGQTIYIAFVNNSFDKYLLFLDNVTVKVLPASDAAMLAMTPSTASYKSYAATGGSIPVQALFQNQGSQTVTNFTVKLNDGVSTQSFPQTGSVLPYGTQVCSFNYTMPSAGIKPIKVWAEVSGDMNHANDSTSSEFGGAAFTPVNNPVFEEATGTWCQWCPRGAVFMDSLEKLHPNVVAIAVHNGDPMTVATYDAGMGPLIGGYPSGLVGRKIEADPSDFLTEYTNHLNDFGVGDLTLSQPTVSGQTITVKADVKMAVSTKANYDYRLTMVVTANEMHGTTSTWNQANAYAGGANGPMGGFESLPSTVPAAQMYYNHVALNIEGGFTGLAGSLPAAMTAGNTYSHTFTYTAPAGQDLSRCKANILLISGLSGEVQNGKWVGVFPTAVNDVIKSENINVFPNPANDYLNVDFTLNKISDVTVSLVDMTGKTVYNNTLTSLNGNQGLVINTMNLANGMYTLSLRTAEGNVTRKVSIAH